MGVDLVSGGTTASVATISALPNLHFPRLTITFP